MSDRHRRATIILLALLGGLLFALMPLDAAIIGWAACLTIIICALVSEPRLT